MTPPPPVSTLFPYTTLFRSRDPGRAEAVPRGDPERGPPRDLPREPRGGRGSRVAPRAAPGEPARAPAAGERPSAPSRSEEHTSELQSLTNLVCRLLLEKKKK